MADDGGASKTSAVDAFHEVAERIARRSLVLIFSDMFDNSEREKELFSALQHLKFNKHEVVLFHVTDKKTELEFDFENRPYTFIDTETGEQVKAHPNEIRDTYLAEIFKFREALKIKCGQYGIDLVEADISEGFNHILLKFLTKRARMK